MLIRVEDDRVLAIGQLSHAWLSGQLARAWGNERFPAPEPREAIALGAEQHDIGWALFDLRPRFNPETGLPCSFLELTVADHLEIWRAAPERLLTQSLHAALVVSLHGRSLSELRAKTAGDGAEELLAHAEQERRRQADLCSALGISPDQMDVIRRQIWTWDGLSLALCHRWDPFTARDVPVLEGLLELELRGCEDGTLAVDPWPFATARLRVRCEARALALRYENEPEMREGFSRAEPMPLEFTLVAP
jgi:hypothetical protein